MREHPRFVEFGVAWGLVQICRCQCTVSPVIGDDVPSLYGCRVEGYSKKDDQGKPSEHLGIATILRW